MKEQLKEITDLTVNELLPQEIILPSEYFECFDKHSKLYEIQINDESFEKEINKLLVKELNNINDYIKIANKNIGDAASITLEAKEAIKENDSNALKKLYSQINQLQNELQNMTDSIYKDYLTKAFNKKWLYHKYLDEEAQFQEDATLILIDIKDLEYIKDNYSKLISNNLLIYIYDFLNKELKKENIEFNICRYLNNKFIISIKSLNYEVSSNLIKNISSVLFGTTLKSNSGIMIKPTYRYSIVAVKKEDSFHEVLATLLRDTKN